MTITLDDFSVEHSSNNSFGRWKRFNAIGASKFRLLSRYFHTRFSYFFPPTYNLSQWRNCFSKGGNIDRKQNRASMQYSKSCPRRRPSSLTSNTGEYTQLFYCQKSGVFMVQYLQSISSIIACCQGSWKGRCWKSTLSRHIASLSYWWRPQGRAPMHGKKMFGMFYYTDIFRYREMRYVFRIEASNLGLIFVPGSKHSYTRFGVGIYSTSCSSSMLPVSLVGDCGNLILIRRGRWLFVKQIRRCQIQSPSRQSRRRRKTSPKTQKCDKPHRTPLWLSLGAS